MLNQYAQGFDFSLLVEWRRKKTKHLLSVKLVQIGPAKLDLLLQGCNSSSAAVRLHIWIVTHLIMISLCPVVSAHVSMRAKRPDYIHDHGASCLNVKSIVGLLFFITRVVFTFQR